jgi:DNA-binding MarR family transcriptional regulator
MLSKPTLHSASPAEWAVLDLLLDRDPEHPYTAREIAAEVGSVARAADALDTLEAAGLIIRPGGVVRLTPTGQTRR